MGLTQWDIWEIIMGVNGWHWIMFLKKEWNWCCFMGWKDWKLGELLNFLTLSAETSFPIVELDLDLRGMKVQKKD